MSLGAAQVLVAWLALAAVAALCGSAFFALLSDVGLGACPPPVSDALARLWRALASVAVMLVPLGFLVATATAYDTTLADALGLIGAAVRDSVAGRLWAARVALTLGLFSVAWVPAHSRLKNGALGVLGALWLVARAMVGHAFDSGALALAVYALHMLAGALWFGAMLGFSLGAAQFDAQRWAAAALGRLWTVAGWCAAVALASGFLIAYGVVHLTLADLLNSRYGHALSAKLLLVAIVIAYGAYIRIRARRGARDELNHHDIVRAVGFNAVLLIGVIELAALLAHSQLPH